MAEDAAPKRGSRPSTPLESLYTADERKLMDDVKDSPSSVGASGRSDAADRDAEGKAGTVADTAAPESSEGAESAAPGTIVGSAFDAYLATRWTALLARDGVFRSKMEGLSRRALAGHLGLVAQFDATHVEHKRATELSEASTAEDAGATPAAARGGIEVFRPFEEDKFHFLKADPREVLCGVNLEQDVPTFDRAAADSKAADDDASGGEGGASATEAAFDMPSHPLMVNVSPLCFGHSLLLPHIAERLPQLLSPDVLLLALRCASMSRRADFRIGFNSLGAWASVNHLHAHILHTSDAVPAPPHLLPVEHAPRKVICECDAAIGAPDEDDEEEAEGKDGGGGGAAAAAAVMRNVRIRVSALKGWPVRGLVFEPMALTDEAVARVEGETAAAAGAVGDADWLEAVADVAGTYICTLIEKNVAHNVLVADGGLRVYVLPRQPQRPLLGGALHAAIVEVCGLVVLRTAEAFAGATQNTVFDALSAEVSLSPEEFTSVTSAFLNMVSSSA